MRLKNILLVVSDIEKSKAFYKELFGLQVITDFGENVMLTEGLVLQEKKVWEDAIGRETVFGGHATELYFEEHNLDLFLERLEASDVAVEFLNRECTHAWGGRALRLYDPDGHVIEVAEVQKR